jgi:hypothetical protein
VLIASTLAACGIAMTPLPVFVAGGTFVAAAVFAFIVDFAKVPVFHRLGIASGAPRPKISSSMRLL